MEAEENEFLCLGSWGSATFPTTVNAGNLGWHPVDHTEVESTPLSQFLTRKSDS